MKYVDLANMKHLTEGLAFNLVRCAEFLDSTLVGLNEKTRIPDIIVSWNEKNPADRAPLAFRDRGRIVVEICQLLTKRGPLFTSTVLESKEEKETAPVVFIKNLSRNWRRNQGSHRHECLCCIGWSHVPERFDRCAVEETGAVAERAADWTTCWRAASEV